MIKAVRIGELSFAAPFTFTAIPMSLLLVWHDAPTPTMLAGVALIIGAGLYLFRSDRAGIVQPPDSTVP